MIPLQAVFRRPTAAMLSRSWRYAASAILVAWLLALSVPATAEIAFFRVGRGSISWQDEASVQIGVGTVDAALRPIQVYPDSNLTQVLQRQRGAFLVGAPRDYTVGGDARIWAIGAGNYNSLPGTEGPLGLVDGMDTTSTGTIFKTIQDQSGAMLVVDLGAAYPINRVRFYPRPSDVDVFMRGFEIFVNDGLDFDDAGLPLWELFAREERNTHPVVDITRQTLPVRTIRIRHAASTRFNVAEIEIYGDGFIPNSSYLSELQHFDVPVNFGQLRVEVRRVESGTPAGATSQAQATIQVRSGADDTPDVYYRRDRNTGIQEEVALEDWERLRRGSQTICFRRDPSTGEILGELSRGEWLRLPTEEQASPCRDYVAGDKRLDVAQWSTWSEPLVVDSTAVFSQALDLPSPREYLQFRILFENGADATMAIERLEVEYSSLLVDSSLGELCLQSEPVPEGRLVRTAPGVDTAFVCAVRTDFVRNGLPGFRGLRFASFPPPVFQSLAVGSPPSPIDTPGVRPTDDGFEVYFDAIQQTNNLPLQVAFRQALVEYVTPVRVWLLPVGNSLPQPVVPGDASPDIGTGTLSVLATEVKPSVVLSLSTPVISPNGDGANDQVVPILVLGQFATEVEVTLQILDLSGRSVRRIYSGSMAPGLHAGFYRGRNLAWSGRGDGGDLVPPGNYLVRLEVNTASRTFTRVSVIGVVY